MEGLEREREMRIKDKRMRDEGGTHLCNMKGREGREVYAIKKI